MKLILKRALEKLDLLEDIQTIRGKIFPTQYQKEQKEILQKRIEFYSQFLKKGDLCFDVGANVGNRVEVFVKMGLRVIAVEPQVECIQILKKKFNKKITIIEKALGSQNGEAKMYLSNATTLASFSKDWIQKVQSNRFTEYKWEEGYTVEIITLQEIIGSFGIPSFCKIDVEGFEFEVIKGLKNPIKTISFEFAIPESTDITIQCVKYLGNLGYSQFNYSLEESMILKMKSWKNKDDMINEIECFESGGISWGDIYAKVI